MGMVSESCGGPDNAGDYRTSGTALNPMLCISGVCTAIILVNLVSLVALQLQRYRCPEEQRQIIRITFAPFVHPVVCSFQVYSYEAAPYPKPLGDLYEALRLCALFLLYIQYAAPGGTFDHETFETVKASDEGDLASFEFPRICWILVFQYPLTEMLSFVILNARKLKERTVSSH